MMRLAIWTAQNDFRESCKSELQAALPQTAACNKTLEQSPRPPPLTKRTASTIVEGHTDWKHMIYIFVTFSTLLLLAWGLLKANKTGQAADSAKSLSQSLAKPAKSFDDKGDATAESTSSTTFEIAKSEHERNITGYAAEQCPQWRPHAVRASSERAVRHDLTSLPPIVNSEWYRYFRIMYVGRNEVPKHAESFSVQHSLTRVPPHRFTSNPFITTDSGMPTAVPMTSTGLNSSIDTKSGLPESLIAIPIVESKKLQTFLYVFAFTCHVIHTAVLILTAGMILMPVTMFRTSRGLFYALALIFGYFATLLVVVAPSRIVTIFVLSAANFACSLGLQRSVDLRTADPANLTLALYMFHFQLFSVYVCLRLIWSIDTFAYHLLIGTTGIGLLAWIRTIIRTTQKYESNVGRSEVDERFLDRSVLATSNS